MPITLNDYINNVGKRNRDALILTIIIMAFRHFSGTLILRSAYMCDFEVMAYCYEFSRETVVMNPPHASILPESKEISSLRIDIRRGLIY